MKKNVLLFASTFPRWETDAITARFVYDLGRELIKYFNVYVLTPHAPGAKRYEEMEGMKVVRFPYFLPLNSQALVDGTGMLSCLRTKKSSILQIPFFIICQYLALKKMVKTYQIDLVNSHWMIPQGLIG
ncbi:MAG: glycosyltransferase family 4 protein, partial [Nitrospinales bacterium]